MTRAPSLLAELLAECEAHGIRLALAGEGGLTIDAPQDALTPELPAQLKTHKAGLLARMRPPAELTAATETASAIECSEAEERAGILEFDGGLSRDEAERRAGLVVEATDGCADAAEADPILNDPDGWPVGSIHPGELTPCPDCGSLELWQAAAGDLFGREPARWRCQKCEPPETARRLRAKAERIKNRMRTRPVDESGRTGSTPSTPNLSR